MEENMLPLADKANAEFGEQNNHDLRGFGKPGNTASKHRHGHVAMRKTFDQAAE
jgi:hypothetical protein